MSRESSHTFKSIQTLYNALFLYLQTIDFESIWHCLAPNCKYLFHPTEMSSTKIVCDFTYYQPSDKELQPKKRTLKIADEYKDVSLELYTLPNINEILFQERFQR